MEIYVGKISYIFIWFKFSYVHLLLLETILYRSVNNLPMIKLK